MKPITFAAALVWFLFSPLSVASEAKRADDILKRAKGNLSALDEMLSLDPAVATMRLLRATNYSTPGGRAVIDVIRRIPSHEMYIYLALAAELPAARGPIPPRELGAPYLSEILPEHKMPLKCSESRRAISRIFSDVVRIADSRFVPVVAALLYEDGYEYDGGDTVSSPVCDMAAFTLMHFRAKVEKGVVSDPLVAAIPITTDVNVLRAWWENNSWRYPPLPALPTLGPPTPATPPPPPTPAVEAPPPGPPAEPPKPAPLPAPAAFPTPTAPPSRWPWLAAAAALAFGLALWARRRKRGG